MTQIAIIGSALSGNKGAAAMLESSIETLSARIPDVRFVLFSMYPSEDSALNTYPHVTIIPATPAKLGVLINSAALAYRIVPPLRPLLRRTSKSVRALRDSAVLLDQGGITFTDGREKFLLYNIASILPALNMKVPVFKCAQAVGPFEGRINRWASRTFLPKVHTLVTRGAITHQYAEKLGLTNLVAGADYAFSLPITDADRESAAARVSPEFFAGNDVVGISPSVVLQKKVDALGRDYIADNVEIITRLLDEGTPVALIPHSVRLNTESTHNNDLPLCREIARRVGQREGFLFVDGELTSQELRAVIGRCGRFVTSRFHAMISSLSMQVPTVVVGWSHKYREVLDMFELSEWAFGAAEFTPDHTLTELARLSANETEVRERLARNGQSVLAVSMQQADLIAAVATAPSR